MNLHVNETATSNEQKRPSVLKKRIQYEMNKEKKLLTIDEEITAETLIDLKSSPIHVQSFHVPSQDHDLLENQITTVRGDDCKMENDVKMATSTEMTVTVATTTQERSLNDPEENTKRSFLQKLHKVLQDETYPDSIKWIDGYDAFIICDKTTFSQEVLSSIFSDTKFTSFTRKLSRWGFTRVRKGPFIGCYYHMYFLKDRPELCSKIYSTRKNWSSKKQQSTYDPFQQTRASTNNKDSKGDKKASPSISLETLPVNQGSLPSYAVRNVLHQDPVTLMHPNLTMEIGRFLYPEAFNHARMSILRELSRHFSPQMYHINAQSYSIDICSPNQSIVSPEAILSQLKTSMGDTMTVPQVKRLNVTPTSRTETLSTIQRRRSSMHAQAAC
jgi:hypothetical protein